MGERHRQGVRVDDLDVRASRERGAEVLDARGIELDRDHAAGPVGEGGCQPAGAGADLDDEVARADARLVDELGGEAGAAEEMLSVRPAAAGTRRASLRAHG